MSCTESSLWHMGSLLLLTGFSLIVVCELLIVVTSLVVYTGCRAQGCQWLWHMNLVAPWHVES